MSDIFGVSDISQGGPGTPPQPWVVGNNIAGFNGCVAVPSFVLGGNTGPGTINTNDLYIKGVSIENILALTYLPLSGGTLTGTLHFPSISALTIPGGTAGQMLSSNGDGTLGWRNVVGVGLPSGGTNGQILATDGATNVFWTSTLPGGPYIPSSSGPFLPLAGGALTGQLTLAANPTVALGAVPKQYADLKLALTGGTMTGALVLAADPTVALAAATKQYADTKFPAAGGTIGGNVAIGGSLSVNSSMSAITTFSIAETGVNANAYIGFFEAGFNPRKGYVGLVSESIILNADGFASLTLSTTAASGQFNGTFIVNGVLNAYSNFNLSGAASIAGGLSAGGITCNGQFYAPNNNVIAGAAVYTNYNTNSTSYINAYNHQYSSQWYWNWNNSNGTLAWVGGNAVRFTIDGGGNGAFTGNLQVNNRINCVAVTYSGSNGISFSYGSPSLIAAIDGSSLGGVICSNIGGWARVYNIAITGATAGMWWPGGSGAWSISVSDRRLKSNIKEPTKDALETICSLPIHELDLKLPDDEKIQHWNWSLIADEVERIIPLAYIAPLPVHPDLPDDVHYASINQLPLVSALIKAVQQLTDRVQFLESKLA